MIATKSHKKSFSCRKPRFSVENHNFLKEEEKTLVRSCLLATLVPIALGKYLFSFRTQKSSPVAAIILRKRETSKVPNYQKDLPRGGLFATIVKTSHFWEAFSFIFLNFSSYPHLASFSNPESPHHIHHDVLYGSHPPRFS